MNDWLPWCSKNLHIFTSTTVHVVEMSIVGDTFQLNGLIRKFWVEYSSNCQEAMRVQSKKIWWWLRGKSWEQGRRGDDASQQQQQQQQQQIQSEVRKAMKYWRTVLPWVVFKARKRINCGFFCTRCLADLSKIQIFHPLCSSPWSSGYDIAHLHSKERQRESYLHCLTLVNISTSIYSTLSWL